MLPKRAVVAIVTTVIALALLLSFKPPDQPAIAGVGLRAGAAIGQPPAVTSVSGDPAASAAPPADQPGSSSPPTADATPAPTRRPNGLSRPRSTQAPAAALANAQVPGPVVQTPYGDVQVQVTVANGKIVDVSALQLPMERARSAMISQYAEPILRSEALQAQSANIDLVSGATYTSMGYQQSLQAALDQVHL